MQDRKTPRCHICREAFDNCLRKPLILLCGHSLCEYCRNASLEVRAFNAAFCSCGEDSTLSCDNCRGTSCPTCRFPRALETKVVDTALIEQLSTIPSAVLSIRRIERQGCAELTKIDHNLGKLKSTIKKHRAELKELEAVKARLAVLKTAEASLEELYSCRDCSAISLPSTRVRVCLLCSDSEHVSVDTSIHIIKDEEKVQENLLCDFCSVYKTCKTSTNRHQTIKYRKLQLLTDVEFQINKICALNDKMDFDTRHPYLFQQRQKYRNTETEEERTQILKNLEEFIMNSRRTIPTLQKELNTMNCSRYI